MYFLELLELPSFLLILPSPLFIISLNELLKSVSANLPYEMRRKPDCSKIVELPLSMLTMDHLEPLMYRANFRSNLQTGEKALKKVCQ